MHTFLTPHLYDTSPPLNLCVPHVKWASYATDQWEIEDCRLKQQSGGGALFNHLFPISTPPCHCLVQLLPVSHLFSPQATYAGNNNNNNNSIPACCQLEVHSSRSDQKRDSSFTNLLPFSSQASIAFWKCMTDGNQRGTDLPTTDKPWRELYLLLCCLLYSFRRDEQKD